jgi:hypothetical protein
MFDLSKKQLAELAKWQVELERDEAPTGAIGGRYTYSFTPTSIGIVSKVKDEVTGDVLDLTDYDMW